MDDTNGTGADYPSREHVTQSLASCVG